jgi:hypothetical protein
MGRDRSPRHGQRLKRGINPTGIFDGLPCGRGMFDGVCTLEDSHFTQGVPAGLHFGGASGNPRHQHVADIRRHGFALCKARFRAVRYFFC